MAAIATRIDCDIHPAVEGTRTTLLPYLDDHWKEQVVSRAIDGLDLNSYPPNMPFCGRADWRPAQGKPGSDLAMVQRGAFDQLGASHAICNVLYGAQAVFEPFGLEARFVGRLATERHLRTILVVSGTAQTTRTRLRFSRCYSGTVLVDPVEPGGNLSRLYSVLYEWGAWIKALTIQRSC